MLRDVNEEEVKVVVKEEENEEGSVESLRLVMVVFYNVQNDVLF